MKAVGVKILKNQLSRYLGLVKDGETILVTDRDEVIAEIHRPTLPRAPRVSPWEIFLNQQERQGSLLRGPDTSEVVLKRKMKEKKTEIDALQLLAEIREDRF